MFWAAVCALLLPGDRFGIPVAIEKPPVRILFVASAAFSTPGRAIEIAFELTICVGVDVFWIGAIEIAELGCATCTGAIGVAVLTIGVKLIGRLAPGAV